MQSSSVGVTTADGVADAHLTRPDSNDAPPAVLFIMDAIGLWRRIEEMADYVAHQGYVVLAPNVLFRAGRARVLALPDLSDADERASIQLRIVVRGIRSPRARLPREHR